jgi:hypothetical protein
MQEWIVDIKSSYRSVRGNNKTEYGSDGSRFYNGAKSIYIVQTFFLGISFGNKLSFKAFN